MTILLRLPKWTKYVQSHFDFFLVGFNSCVNTHIILYTLTCRKTVV